MPNHKNTAIVIIYSTSIISIYTAVISCDKLSHKFKELLRSPCNRCGTPLGSARRRQMKAISKNINSSNDMKTQTSKCHLFWFVISSAFIVHVMFVGVSCGSCGSSPKSLEADTPSANLLVVQTFKRHLSFLSIIPWCIGTIFSS